MQTLALDLAADPLGVTLKLVELVGVLWALYVFVFKKGKREQASRAAGQGLVDELARDRAAAKEDRARQKELSDEQCQRLDKLAEISGNLVTITTLHGEKHAVTDREINRLRDMVEELRK